MAGAPSPLRLKDLLELDCDSCSAAGFRCYPRRLGESAPAPPTRRLLDSPPPSLRQLHPTSKLSSSLSRTISRRLGFFWRRRDEDGGEDDAAASGSESGASSETTTTTSDNSSRRRGSRCESDSDFSTATVSSASDSMDAVTVAATADEHEAMKSSVSEADDKEAEQLSPVAVMDFPFDDDEGEDAGACSPSPSFSLERLQRRKMLRRTQHKIRRLGSTEELGPMNLEALLAATSDDANDLTDNVPKQLRVTHCRTEDVARPSRSRHVAGVRHEHDGILTLLMDAGMDPVTKRLLLDFFVEMKRRRGGSMEHWGELSSAPAELLLLPREADRLGDGDVLATARGWLDGAGSERWGLNDVLRGGEGVVAEMERGRRWMQVGEEKREVGVVVAGMMVDQLVDEVVRDLLV